MNDRCDVLIVGGGPAGSACAWRLAQSGADVVIIDQKQFPRVKPCAGWITPPVIDLLQIDTDEYARERVFQPLTGFRTGLIGVEPVETWYERPVSYGIRRYEFDDYLLARSGARRLLGEPVRTIERDGDDWVVNRALRTPVLVGAGGHFCPVARMLGARAGEKSVVAAQEVEFEASVADLDRGSIAPEAPELFFCEDLKGYGWCFRKGNYLNIGLGRVDREQLSTHVETFCQFLRDTGKVVCDLPERFHGHAYQLYERTAPKLADEGVLLVGDAAGLAYPQSGEGIRPAVESALIAAETILAARGSLSSADVAGYIDRVTKRFGAPRQRGPADWLPAGWLQFVAARLLASRWFSRRVVLDRWFLHADKEALAL